MASIKQAFGTAAILAFSGTAINALTDTSSTLSDEVDNSTDAMLAAEFEVKLDGAAGCVDTVDLYMARSMDGTDFSDEALLSNLLFMGSVTMNGVAAVTKVFRIEQLPVKYKVLVVNESAGTLSGTCEIYQRGTYLTNA